MKEIATPCFGVVTDMPGKRPAVLHLVNTLEGGGTERMLLRLLQRMDRSRRRHVLVTLRGAGSFVSELPPEVACVALDARGRRKRLGGALVGAVRECGAAVLHARNTGTWADATLAKLLHPRVSLLLGFHGLDHAGPFSRRDRLVAAAATRFGATFTTVAHSGKSKLRDELGIPPGRIVVIPNGADERAFHRIAPACREESRRALGIPDQAFVVGSVGSLVPVKRQDLLIEALAALSRHHPRIRLLLVGNGPLRRELIEQCRTLGLAELVLLPGALEDVRPAYAAMDAYVCASDAECFNNALIEAAACGRPIVATNVGDNANVIRHGREGLIVPPADPVALTEALEAMVTQPRRCALLGRDARSRAGAFTLTKTVAAYESLYETVAAGADRGVRLGPHQLAPCFS